MKYIQCSKQRTILNAAVQNLNKYALDTDKLYSHDKQWVYVDDMRLIKIAQFDMRLIKIAQFDMRLIKIAQFDTETYHSLYNNYFKMSGFT